MLARGQRYESQRDARDDPFRWRRRYEFPILDEDDIFSAPFHEESALVREEDFGASGAIDDIEEDADYNGYTLDMFKEELIETNFGSFVNDW